MTNRITSRTDTGDFRSKNHKHLCQRCNHTFTQRYMLDVAPDAYLCVTCAVKADYVDAEDIIVTDPAAPP